MDPDYVNFYIKLVDMNYDSSIHVDHCWSPFPDVGSISASIQLSIFAYGPLIFEIISDCPSFLYADSREYLSNIFEPVFFHCACARISLCKNTKFDFLYPSNPNLRTFHYLVDMQPVRKQNSHGKCSTYPWYKIIGHFGNRKYILMPN